MCKEKQKLKLFKLSCQYSKRYNLEQAIKVKRENLLKTLRSGNQIEVPPPVAAPAPEPVKLHSTPEKEDEIVARSRNYIFFSMFKKLNYLLFVLNFVDNLFLTGH